MSVLLGMREGMLIKIFMLALCTKDTGSMFTSPPQPYSGVAAPKTGLQWQQPFLELVLACMHAQSTTHEELLGPLKTQISTFLAAFEKVCTIIVSWWFYNYHHIIFTLLVVLLHKIRHTLPEI